MQHGPQFSRLRLHSNQPNFNEFDVVVVVFVLVLVSDAYEGVCMCRSPQTCMQPRAN